MYSRSLGQAMTLTLLTGLGALAAPQAAAQRARVEIPQQTIVRLELAESINSRSATRGERVLANLDEEDTSGFPTGTRFEGVVTDVRRATERRPAMLDMEFRRAILPNGSSERIRADLASLAADHLRTAEEGRLESRRQGGGFDWKWVGYGAAGGAVLGEILGDDFLKGTLLGGLGGAVYGYLNRDDGESYREVELERGTDFGIRLLQPVAFNPAREFRFRDRTARDRVLGSRDEYRLDGASVTLDGRPVRFTEARPMRVNGVAYVPLQPLADAAGWTLGYPRGADEFTLRLPESTVRGRVGATSVTRAGRTYTLDAAPMSIGGELYVPLEYVSRVGGVRVGWNRGTRRAAADDPGGNAPRLEVNGLVQGLATFPFSDLKSSVLRWRRVDVEPMLGAEERRLLGTLITENSLARRNRNLLTNLLREAELLTNTQTVVGVSNEKQIIYVD